MTTHEQTTLQTAAVRQVAEIAQRVGRLQHELDTVSSDLAALEGMLRWLYEADARHEERLPV